MSNEDHNEAEQISPDQLKSGDMQEFTRAVNLYSPRIYRLALKMLDDTQDAEDVLQETFLKALRALPEFQGRASFSTWLYRIAVNEALMMGRKRHPETVSLDEPEEFGEDETPEPREIKDWCCLPEEELLTAEARHHLDEAIQKLPEVLRVVFVLRDIEGLSIKETAEALDLTETTVKTRLFRARLKLRDDLSAYYGERISEKKANE